MVILSLFDGASMGQQALVELGIPITRYYASEVDKYAIQIAQKNHPDTIQLGDVRNWREWGIDWGSIDLLLGGSPCQGFSFSGKGLNFDDPRSKLFFEYADILNHIRQHNPNVHFLLENVRMKQEHQDVITGYLGVEPKLINSAAVSAQNRVRLYWASWGFPEPEPRPVFLHHVLDSKEKLNPAAIRGRYRSAAIVGARLNDRGVREDGNKQLPTIQCLEVRKINQDKCNCLTTVEKNTVVSSMQPGRYPDVYNRSDLDWRYLSIPERCRLMGLPDDYITDIPHHQAVKITGNGWEVNTIKHIFSFIHD